jgi:hypothetical protein
MPLSPVRRLRLTESVADRLISMLHTDGYRAGAKLPSERELRILLTVGWKHHHRHRHFSARRAAAAPRWPPSLSGTGQTRTRTPKS